MSGPYWREVFARALYLADGPDKPPPRLVPLQYGPCADAILIAIAERGYRLHRDHVMKHERRLGIDGFRCTRCGHWDTDLGMPPMSCEDRA